MSLGILLGLGAALGWGCADMCARFSTYRIGSYRTLLYMQPLGLFGLSLWFLLLESPRWDWPLVGLAALLACGNTLAGLCLYQAIAVGLISVVSPIAASYGAITLLLGLLSGQKPSVLQLLGLVVTIGGVVLASAPLFQSSSSNPAKPKLSEPVEPKPAGGGVGLALVAAVCFGVVFWGLGFVTPRTGGVLPVWANRLVGPLLLLGLAGPFRQNVRLPGRRDWLWLVALGVLDTAAFLCYSFGVRQADSGIVAVLSSLFSAVTVLLARLFLKERLAANQWIGIGLLLVGVGLVSAG